MGKLIPLTKEEYEQLNKYNSGLKYTFTPNMPNDKNYCVYSDDVKVVCFDENYESFYDIDYVVIDETFGSYLEKIHPVLKYTKENGNYIVKLSSLMSIKNICFDKDTYKYLSLFKDNEFNQLSIDGLSEEQINTLLEKYPNIQELNISNVDVGILSIDNLKELYKINFQNNNIFYLMIFSNSKLCSINGIETSKIQDLEVYDNSMDVLKYEIIPLIKSGIKVKVDVSYYPFIKSDLEEENIHDISFIEAVGAGEVDHIKYHLYDIEKLYKNIDNIFSNYIKKEYSDELKYAIIYYWITQNVIYDDLYRSEGRSKSHNIDGTKYTRRGYSNGVLKGIEENISVCEGYTKLAQFILNMYDINTKNIYCSDKESNVANHSILKVELEKGSYYSDITNGASKLQSGTYNFKEQFPFLLNRDDVLKNQKLYGNNQYEYSYDKANFSKSYSNDEFLNLYKQAEKIIACKDFENFKKLEIDNGNKDIDYCYLLCNRKNNANKLTQKQLSKELVILTNKLRAYEKYGLIDKEEINKLLLVVYHKINDEYMPIAIEKEKNRGVSIIKKSIDENKDSLDEIIETKLKEYLSNRKYKYVSSDIAFGEIENISKYIIELYENKKIKEDTFNKLSLILDNAKTDIKEYN